MQNSSLSMGLMLLLVINFYSCTLKEDKEANEVLNIKLQENVSGSVKISEILLPETVLMLEDSGFLNFGEVVGFENIAEDFVLHTDYPGSISIIDKNGKTKHQLIPDFRIKEITAFDIFDNQIFILDRSSRSLFIYDKQLNYERQIKIPVLSQSFQLVDKERVALYVGNEISEFNKGKVLIFNFLTNKIELDFLPISENQRKYFNFMTRNHFLRIGKDNILWDSSLDEIFLIDHKEMRPFYHLDFGSSKLPKGYYEEASFENAFDFLQTLRATSFAFRPFRVLANEERMLINYEKSGDFITSWVNLRNGSAKNFINFEDDLFGLTNINEVKLSFIISLYGENNFAAFVPFELLEKENSVREDFNTAKELKRNLLILGKVK